jgi:AAA15 family ATPase/GTPase
MTNHFISNISIENFKCFQNLQIEGIETVNLIGGKNNVGKTAFLEAVEMLVSSNKANDIALNVYNLLMRRQPENIYTHQFEIDDMQLDFFKENETQFTIYTANKKLKVWIEKTKDIISKTKLFLVLNKEKVSLFTDDMLRGFHRNRQITVDNVHFIRSTKTSEQDIAILYGSLVDLDREDFLNDSLKIFDDNIISIKQRATENRVILKLKLKDRKMPVLLSSLGEGINRYIAILCAIWASKDGFLLIDEIENGIHYTNYKKLWQLIFQASADASCQLFITSHSKECIEAFNEVQLKYNEGAYFEFYKNLKTDMITASKRHKEQLKYSLTHQGRVRGE